jgi:hypothetical protein
MPTCFDARISEWYRSRHQQVAGQFSVFSPPCCAKYIPADRIWQPIPVSLKEKVILSHITGKLQGSGKIIRISRKDAKTQRNI